MQTGVWEQRLCLCLASMARWAFAAAPNTSVESTTITSTPLVMKVSKCAEVAGPLEKGAACFLHTSQPPVLGAVLQHGFNGFVKRHALP